MNRGVNFNVQFIGEEGERRCGRFSSGVALGKLCRGPRFSSSRGA
jgi:hypothetical protein